MNTQNHDAPMINETRTGPIPQTARGRALYSVGWYLRGRRDQRDYDRTCAALSDVR